MSLITSEQMIFNGKLIAFVYDESPKIKILFEIIYLKDNDLHL